MSTQTSTRPNTYPGTCTRCHGHVPAQGGLLGGKVNGRWTVTHTTCPTTSSPARPAAPATAPQGWSHASRGYTSRRAQRSIDDDYAFAGDELADQY